MTNYQISVQELSAEDGGGYLASAPDLPGCISDGETRAEAIANCQKAIMEWIDECRRMGRHVPAPT